MRSSRREILAALLAASLTKIPQGRADEAPADDVLALARHNGVLEVGVYNDFPPFSWGASGQQAQGIDVALAHVIAQSVGLELKIRMIEAGDSVSDDLRNHVWKGHYLGGGVADLMLHVGVDPVFAARESNVSLFAPYFHETVVIAYLPARIPHLDSPIALSEHRIAVEGDTISDHILSSGYGGALRSSAVRKLSLEDAVEALKAEEVDGVMGPRGELQGLIFAQGMKGIEFHVQPPVGQMRTTWDVGIAVKKAGGGPLRAAVSQAVSKCKADGSLQRIFAQYGVELVDPPATAAVDSSS